MPSDQPLPSSSCHRALRLARGFSLVELLVVVCIIGLLVALAFPLLNKALLSSKLTKCATNLRQWGIGIQLYTADNDGFLPQSAEVMDTSIGGPGNTSWQERIAPYLVGSLGVTGNPATTNQRSWLRRTLRCPGDKASIGDGIVYGSNDYLRASINGKAPKKLIQINQRLNDFMVLGENYTGELWDSRPGATWNTPGRVDYTRHGPNNIANFLFADFHVEALSYQQTLDRPMIFAP